MRKRTGLDLTAGANRQIRSGDEARAALIAGIESMAMLVRPTLGPLARTVAVEALVSGRPPEILDDAATISRRVEQLPDPFEDMGAMLVREMALGVREGVGDGAATATVIAHSLVKQAFSFIASGGDPIQLGADLDRAASLGARHLRQVSETVGSEYELGNVASGALRERHIADLVAEAVEAVGPDGTVRVEKGYLNQTLCEYTEGLQWAEGVLSPYFLAPARSEARLVEPVVLVTSHPLVEASQLLPTLEACLAAGYRNLFLITPALSGSALQLLIANLEGRVIDRAIAVRAPGSDGDQYHILGDIATVTGGRFVSSERGDHLRDIQAEDLGRAREAWATWRTFGLLGGYGSRDGVRARVLEARGQLADQGRTAMTLDRIAKLTGVSAVIHVGAATESERAELQPRVEAAVKSTQAALGAGVLPGGGAALVGCGRALEGAQGQQSVAARMLARSLEEPLRAISENAGLDAGPIVSEASRRGEGWTFDVVRGQWVEGTASGLVDALPVVLTALEAAVSLATTVISMEGLVRRQRPLATINP